MSRVIVLIKAEPVSICMGFEPKKLWGMAYGEGGPIPCKPNWFPPKSMGYDRVWGLTGMGFDRVDCMKKWVHFFKKVQEILHSRYIIPSVYTVFLSA